jgi:hypothetical protein
MFVTKLRELYRTVTVLSAVAIPTFCEDRGEKVKAPRAVTLWVNHTAHPAAGVI